MRCKSAPELPWAVPGRLRREAFLPINSIASTVLSSPQARSISTLVSRATDFSLCGPLDAINQLHPLLQEGGALIVRGRVQSGPIFLRHHCGTGRTLCAGPWLLGGHGKGMLQPIAYVKSG